MNGQRFHEQKRIETKTEQFEGSLRVLFFFSRIQTTIISKLFDATRKNFQGSHSLWMSTKWYQAKVCRFCGL